MRRKGLEPQKSTKGHKKESEWWTAIAANDFGRNDSRADIRAVPMERLRVELLQHEGVGDREGGGMMMMRLTWSLDCAIIQRVANGQNIRTIRVKKDADR